MSPDPELGDHTPYVVARAQLQGELARAPLGQPIAATDRFDPTRSSSAPFLRLVERLDALAYGPAGLATPRWALYDCAALPGVLLGLGRERARLDADVCRILKIPDGYSGLVPLSLYVAVPMLESRHWLGFALCSVNDVLPKSGPPDLPLWTLALGLEVLQARRVTGTTQWASPRLATYARFGPLELLAAWLPAHTVPASCVFRFDCDRQRVDRALGPPPPAHPDALDVDVRDPARLRALQQALESGRQLWITGMPEPRALEHMAPIREVTPS